MHGWSFGVCRDPGRLGICSITQRCLTEIYKLAVVMDAHRPQPAHYLQSGGNFGSKGDWLWTQGSAATGGVVCDAGVLVLSGSARSPASPSSPTGHDRYKASAFRFAVCINSCIWRQGGKSGTEPTGHEDPEINVSRGGRSHSWRSCM